MHYALKMLPIGVRVGKTLKTPPDSSNHHGRVLRDFADDAAVHLPQAPARVFGVRLVALSFAGGVVAHGLRSLRERRFELGRQPQGGEHGRQVVPQLVVVERDLRAHLNCIRDADKGR